MNALEAEQLIDEMIAVSDEIGVAALRARVSPGRFAQYSFGEKWEFARHLRLIDDAVSELIDGDLDGLIVEMPPRHGKSQYLSETFSAWFVGTFPDKRVILSSYEARFAASWGRKARDKLIAHSLRGDELFDVEVRTDSRAKDEWNLVGRDGGMNTAGVGGALTGKGADLLIIDDPIKNADEAMSESRRDSLWDWFQSTAETRLEPGGRVVVIQTRWHEDDLAGRLINEMEAGERPGWARITLPALAEENDILGRVEGEALWPERYDAEYFENLRRRLSLDVTKLGPYWFEALYQQRPARRDGNIFRSSWFKYWTTKQIDGREMLVLNGNGSVLRENCWAFSTVDLAISQKETADFFVVSTWLVSDKSDLILVDVQRDRLESPDQVSLIKSVYERLRPMFIDIESNAYQLALVQQLVREGVPVRARVTTKDKVARAQSFAVRMEAGQVYFPRDADMFDLEQELKKFPNGKNDDFVDTCSMAADRLMKYAAASIG